MGSGLFGGGGIGANLLNTVDSLFSSGAAAVYADVTGVPAPTPATSYTPLIIIGIVVIALFFFVR
jgi:hypothetical protein